MVVCVAACLSGAWWNGLVGGWVPLETYGVIDGATIYLATAR
jgi:hypothetical protein